MIRTLRFLMFISLSVAAGLARAANYDEPPRVMAALQQGNAAEHGKGIRKNYSLAIALYCDAGSMGSPEGFFRIGRILATGPVHLRNRRKANAYLALAARLGHQDALKHYDQRVDNADVSDGCGSYYAWMEMHHFDLDSYVANLSAPKRKIAALINNMAPKYGVDTRLALSIALAESNLEPRAVSPKNAQGVMQLMPATQERFGINNAFDPKQNIRGGLSYLKWLQKRFAGNRMFVAAAYNAGEGAVEKYSGIPPFAETQQYVRRVMYFSGTGTPTATGAKKD
jgi:TPR repeat protein